MANIPGMAYGMTGAGGPYQREIVKTDKGYAIGWSPIGYWGGYQIEGTSKHIAKQAFFQYVKLSKSILEWVPILGAFRISFYPETICTLDSSLIVQKGLDTEILLKEVTEELDRLKVFIPFS